MWIISIMNVQNILRAFQATNCECSTYDNTVKLSCRPGQDDFNIPGLHVASDIAHLTREIFGDFTFSVRCTLHGCSKFDAAGIYLMCEGFRVKHGLEFYSENNFRVVTVRTFPLSDESNGNEVAEPIANLIATREKNIFSFYSSVKGQLRFDRAFALYEADRVLKVGLFVQSPFSSTGASATFTELNIEDFPSEHQRL